MDDFFPPLTGTLLSDGVIILYLLRLWKPCWAVWRNMAANEIMSNIEQMKFCLADKPIDGFSKLLTLL